MNNGEDIPPLLYGCSGVPGELDAYLRQQELEALREQWRAEGRAGDPPDKHPRPHAFMLEGVKRVARELSKELEQDRSGAVNLAQRMKREGEPSRAREFRSRVPERIRSWTYALHAYCYKHRQSVPAALMELTFAVLECNERAPSPELLTALSPYSGVSSENAHQEPALKGIRNIPAFLKAAELDGEADAEGKPLSVNALAGEVGVERATVRKWRTRADYAHRRRFVAFTVEYWQNRSEL